MLPEEARGAMRAGMADKLMMDWFTPDSEYDNRENIYALCPATSEFGDGGFGCGGTHAPTTDEIFPRRFSLFWIGGRDPLPIPCGLLKDNRCTIHDSGFKPIECRMVRGCTDDNLTRRTVVKSWDTDEGRAVIAEWKAMVAYREPEEELS
jgi:hypothetical protein